MREYLDKQKLLMALNDKYHDMSAMPASYYAGFQHAIKLIERLNVSEEVAPVKHGKWIAVDHEYGAYMCSVCQTADADCSDYWETHNVKDQDYCPYCGAMMNWEAKEDEK